MRRRYRRYGRRRGFKSYRRRGSMRRGRRSRVMSRMLPMRQRVGRRM